MVGLPKAETEAIVAGNRVPALVVTGTRDPDFPDATVEARWLGRGLGTEPLIVDGAGHYPHLEMPERVAPALLAGHAEWAAWAALPLRPPRTTTVLGFDQIVALDGLARTIPAVELRRQRGRDRRPTRQALRPYRQGIPQVDHGGDPGPKKVQRLHRLSVGNPTPLDSNSMYSAVG